MDIDTVSEAFIQFLQDQGFGTFGTDLYLGQVPDDAQDVVYWVVTTGGSPIQKLRSGEKVKQYFITVNYRGNQTKEVEKKLFELEELLNCTECVNLEDFDVIEIEATQFPTDVDMDSEERRVGFVQANVKLYKRC
jgi:hypothetical protein